MVSFTELVILEGRPHSSQLRILRSRLTRGGSAGGSVGLSILKSYILILFIRRISSATYRLSISAIRVCWFTVDRYCSIIPAMPVYSVSVDPIKSRSVSSVGCCCRWPPFRKADVPALRSNRRPRLPPSLLWPVPVPLLLIVLMPPSLAARYFLILGVTLELLPNSLVVVVVVVTGRGEAAAVGRTTNKDATRSAAAV